MREREDDVVMITRQEPRPLPRQPALGLEIRTLWTGAVAARIVPDTGDVAIGARLDMTAQGGCPALHEGVRGAAYVGRQGMALLIGGKGVLEDRLERDERHRSLRTRGRRLSSGCFLQYHASYPRDKRLVQEGLSAPSRTGCVIEEVSCRMVLRRLPYAGPSGPVTPAHTTRPDPCSGAQPQA